MVIVGCQSIVAGAPTVERADVPAYRASVSSSLADWSSRSSVSSSQRAATASKEAVHASCDPLSTSSVNATDAVNAFVFAFNSHASDVDTKIDPAVQALNSSADLVQGSLSAALPGELREALVAWVDAARDVARVIANTFDMDAFNAAVRRLNDVKTRALDLCDAAY